MTYGIATRRVPSPLGERRPNGWPMLRVVHDPVPVASAEEVERLSAAHPEEWIEVDLGAMRQVWHRGRMVSSTIDGAWIAEDDDGLRWARMRC